VGARDRHAALLSPASLGPVPVRNRVVSSSHQTGLLHEHLPTDDLLAYHQARARGGVGAIFIDATAVHPTGLLTALVGLTRAHIADPELIAKTAAGRAGTVIECVGCNQAGIGHYHAGVPIGCAVNPRTGRERTLPGPTPRRPGQRILVIGAGPAGAAATVVLAQGRMPADELWPELAEHPGAVRAGDVLGPRTLEEAVLEGTLAVRPRTPVPIAEHA
jgi:NADH:flavin oxidoreductase / NADH oxidase family